MQTSDSLHSTGEVAVNMRLAFEPQGCGAGIFNAEFLLKLGLFKVVWHEEMLLGIYVGLFLAFFNRVGKKTLFGIL